MRSRSEMCFKVPMTLLKPLKQLSEGTLFGAPTQLLPKIMPHYLFTRQLMMSMP